MSSVCDPTCALWVVLMQHSSLQCRSWLCFGCVQVFLTIRLFCDTSNDLTDVGFCPLALQSSLHTQDKRNLGEEAAYVRALGENYRSTESDWILM